MVEPKDLRGSVKGNAGRACSGKWTGKNAGTDGRVPVLLVLPMLFVQHVR